MDRLLDQQEIELVEPTEVVDVVARVGLVGIHLQWDVGVALADDPGRLEIPAWLNLQFDAPVALGHVAVDFGHQRVDRVIGRDPGGDPAGDLVARRTEVSGEGLSGSAQLGIEDGKLEGAPRHGMSADRAQDGGDLLCGEIAIQQTRDEVVAPHEHHGIVELMAVEGICGGNALTPADPDVGGDLHEQNILGVLGEE